MIKSFVVISELFMFFPKLWCLMFCLIDTETKIVLDLSNQIFMYWTMLNDPSQQNCVTLGIWLIDKTSKITSMSTYPKTVKLIFKIVKSLPQSSAKMWSSRCWAWCWTSWASPAWSPSSSSSPPARGSRRTTTPTTTCCSSSSWSAPAWAGSTSHSPLHSATVTGRCHHCH